MQRVRRGVSIRPARSDAATNAAVAPLFRGHKLLAVTLVQGGWGEVGKKGRRPDVGRGGQRRGKRAADWPVGQKKAPAETTRQRADARTQKEAKTRRCHRRLFAQATSSPPRPGGGRSRSEGPVQAARKGAASDGDGWVGNAGELRREGARCGPVAAVGRAVQAGRDGRASGAGLNGAWSKERKAQGAGGGVAFSGIGK